jgi:hypothetical protein
MKTRAPVSKNDRRRVQKPLITLEAMAAVLARLQPYREKRAYTVSIGFCNLSSEECKKEREKSQPEYVTCG